MLRAFLAALAIASAAFSWPAHGQDPAPIPCMTRESLIASLAERFKEAPAARALSHQGGMVEILTSEDGSTWTAIFVLPNLCAQFLDFGTDWQTVIAPVGDPS